MFVLSVKFKDGRSLLLDNVTYIDLSDLPYVSYEVDKVPDIQGFEIDDSVTFFSFSYFKNFDHVLFKEDSEAGGFDISEFCRVFPVHLFG